MNMSKTGVMSFGCILGNVLVGEDVVGGLNKGRFLGLWVYSGVIFESHIEQLNRRLGSGCYALQVIAAAVRYS